MTLCISYKRYKKDTFSQAIAIADSQLTVVGPKSQETATLLPSNVEIRHKTDNGIKIHIIESTNSSEYSDIIVSIAGNIALGLQSVIHLESSLRGMYYPVSYKSLLKIIDNTINKFWQGTYDEEIEYLFTLSDRAGEIKILKKMGERGKLHDLDEIQSEQDITIGVIGEEARIIKKTILCEANKIMICRNEVPLFVAIEVASIRALRKEIEDDQNLLVGGHMQMAILDSRKATYVNMNYKGENYFRGISYGKEIDLNVYPLNYTPWSFGNDLFDPEKQVEEFVNQIILK